MDDPIEICMNISGHIIAKIKEHYPTFQCWHTIDKILNSCTSVELYIADQQPPAFVSVKIHCMIPSESYNKRLISIQTHSEEWYEDDYPGIRMIEGEIRDILKDESQRDNYTPTFAFLKLYSNAKEISQGLEIRFQEILCEFDVTSAESPDYVSIAEDALKDIEAVYKVLLWVRKSDEHKPED